MKNFFKSIGKATAYFMVYLMTQVIISSMYGVIWTANKTAELMAAGEEVDALLLTEQLSAQIMDQAMAMTFWAGVVTLIIYWIRFAVRKKNFLKEVEIKSIPTKGILPIVMFAVSFNVIVSVVVTYFPWPQAWMDAYMENSSSLDGSLMSWLAAVLMAPVLEEIVFRGLIYTRLKKGMPTIVAAILASLVFGLMHGTIIWVLYAFVLGMVMTWIFERYQSLTANIIFHLAFNAMGLVLSAIPESMEFIVWIFFVAGIVGTVVAVKQILKITVMEDKKEETVEEKVCEA